jgi:plasmid maintenance system antidote protein VapI
MAVLGALGDLVLSLSADTARFQSDLGRANRVGEKFGRDMGRVLGRLAGILVALGGAAGFGALVRGQINAADAAGKLSQQLGISVEQLSALQVQADLAKVSQQQLGVGLGMLAKNQADFIAGTGEARMAFQALGITQEQMIALNGDTAKIFDLVAGKLATYGDDANKTALAMKIFGESGKLLIPLINDLERTRKEAELLGRVIDQDTSNAATRFNDNLTKMGVVVQGVGLNIARGVLPTLESMSERMLKAAMDTEGLGKAGAIANAGLKLLANVGTIITTIFQIAGETLGGFGAMVVQILTGRFGEAAETSKNIFIDWQERVNEAVRSIDDTWDTTAGSIVLKAPETAKKLAAPALQAVGHTEKAAAAMRAAIMRVHDDATAAMEADIEIQKRQQDEIEKLAEARASSMMEGATETEVQQRLTEDLYDSQIRLSAGIRSADRSAQDFGFVFNSALEDAIINGEKLSVVMRALAQDIARAMLRQSVTQPLAGAAGNFISNLFGGVGDGTAAAGRMDLGGLDFSGIPAFASGTNFVPKTGLAVVHAGERIVSAEDNRGGGGFTINNNIHVEAGASISDVRAAVEQGNRRTISTIRELNRR